jgi:hypothetical protein
MQLEPGQLWRDESGHARICGLVPVEGVDYAVMLRTRGSGGRKRRPFLYPVASLVAGDDGWHMAEESTPPPQGVRPDAMKGSVNTRVSNANVL